MIIKLEINVATALKVLLLCALLTGLGFNSYTISQQAQYRSFKLTEPDNSALSSYVSIKAEMSWSDNLRKELKDNLVFVIIAGANNTTMYSNYNFTLNKIYKSSSRTGDFELIFDGIVVNSIVLDNVPVNNTFPFIFKTNNVIVIDDQLVFTVNYSLTIEFTNTPFNSTKLNVCIWIACITACISVAMIYTFINNWLED